MKPIGIALIIVMMIALLAAFGGADRPAPEYVPVEVGRTASGGGSAP